MRAIGTHLPEGWRELVDPAWLEGWEPRAFEVEGGTTQVVTMGQGPPLVLVPPLPTSTVAHPAPSPAKPRALPPPAKLSLPGIPMLAGLGTLMLASLAGVTVLVIIRRRRAGSPPAG